MQLSGRSRENVVQRWIDWAPLWLGIGIAVYFLLPEEPPRRWLLALPFLLSLCWLLRRRLRPLTASLAVAAAMLGFACASWQTDRVAMPILSAPLEQVAVEGRIREMVPQDKRLRITLDRLAIDGLDAVRTPGAVRVTVAARGMPLAIGQRVAMRATLSAPARPVMPGAFDFGRYFFFRQIGGIGYALPPVTVVEASGEHPWHREPGIWMARLRLTLKQYFLRTLPGEEGKIAAALVTGDQSLVSDQVADEMRVAGLTHILAISGMHMTIVCGFVFYLVRLLLAAIPAVRHRVDVKKAAALVAILTGSFYLWLADFPISAVRAHVMIVLYLAAILIGREADSLRSLVLAAVVIFLVLPSSLLEPGFQLSFAAVLALILFYRRRQERIATEEWQHKPFLLRALAYPLDVLLTTLVATAATAPIVAYHFHQFAPYGLFANMAAIPLASFYITPLMLLAIPAALVGLDASVLHAAGWGIAAMVRIGEIAAGMPQAVIPIPPIGMPGIGLMLIGAFLLLRRGWRAKGAAAALVMLGMATAFAYRPPDLLVAGNSKAIALRQDAGWRLIQGTSRQFVVREWESSLGVTMDAAATPAACDREGCRFALGARRIALPRYPHAAYDDCALADLVMLLDARHPVACAAALIDARALAEHGAYAVRRDGDRLILQSSCDASGDRPWTRCPRAGR